MKSTEFKQITLAVSELDHHQRKRLLETLAHQTDEVQVTEVIESSFDDKKACPHCHGVATHYLANYLGWRHALEKHFQLTPESLLNKDLGNFQYLRVT